MNWNDSKSRDVALLIGLIAVVILLIFTGLCYRVEMDTVKDRITVVEGRCR